MTYLTSSLSSALLTESRIAGVINALINLFNLWIYRIQLELAKIFLLEFGTEHV